MMWFPRFWSAAWWGNILWKLMPTPEQESSLGNQYRVHLPPRAAELFLVGTAIVLAQLALTQVFKLEILDALTMGLGLSAAKAGWILNGLSIGIAAGLLFPVYVRHTAIGLPGARWPRHLRWLGGAVNPFLPFNAAFDKVESIFEAGFLQPVTDITGLGWLFAVGIVTASGSLIAYGLIAKGEAHYVYTGGIILTFVFLEALSALHIMPTEGVADQTGEDGPPEASDEPTHDIG